MTPPDCPLCGTPCTPHGSIIRGVVDLWACHACQPRQLWPSWLWPIDERLDRDLIDVLTLREEVAP